MIQIEINLLKLERGLREGRVKVTRGGKTFYRKQRVGRKEGEKEVDNKIKEWQDWQQYYRNELYRPSVSGHEDYVSQSIMIAESPQHAKTLIRRFQAKDPSSMGFDLAADFDMMYRQTKDKVFESS